MPNVDETASGGNESPEPLEIEQKPEAPRKKKRYGLRIGVFALIAVILIGGGVWLAPLIQERFPALKMVLPEPAQDPLIAGTAAQVEKLSQRLAALEARPLPVVGGGGDEEALAALGARLDALEARPVPLESGDFAARFDGLEGKLETLARDAAGQERISDTALASLRRELDALNEKLARVQSAPKASGDFVGAAFFVALGELRRQIDAGAPYRREFARLETLTRQGRPADPATASYLSILSRHADAGVATLTVLRDSFAPVADAAIEGVVSTDEGMWQRAWRSVAGVVKIRRVGEVEGDSADAIVARTQARLDDGDVAAAVGEMAGLKEPSDSAAAWIEAAVAHLQTREALGALEERGFWGSMPPS